MNLCAPIIQIKNVKAGSTMGYELAAVWGYQKIIKIALVEFGYMMACHGHLKSTDHQSGGQFYFDNAHNTNIGQSFMNIILELT